jgi:hypothetical protein
MLTVKMSSDVNLKYVLSHQHKRQTDRQTERETDRQTDR